MNKTQNSQNPKNSALFDTISLGILLGYLVVDFLPNFGRGDGAPPHFLYLNIFNILVAASILYFPQLRKGFDVKTLGKHPLFLVYILFILLSGITLFTAINQSLALVAYSRILLVAGMAINLAIIFHQRLHLFYTICLIVGTAGMMQFANILYKIDLSADWEVLSKSLAIHLKGNTGNINIFSASLLYKIPFILIGIWHYGARFRGLWLCLALVMTLSGVLLVNARASLLALIAILLVFIAYTIITHKKDKNLLIRGSIILIPLAISFLWVNNIRKDSTDSRYGRSTIERLQDINTEDGGAQARFMYWNNALKFAGDNPLFGIGLGNWRVESIAYEAPRRSSVSLNTHNDYLEVLAETGIPTGIVYFSIFVLLLVFNLKNLFKSKTRDAQYIALLALMVLIVYGNDAIFNFPLYRPTMQVAFAFLMGITLASSPKISIGQPMPKLHLLLLILIPILPLYASYHSDRAMVLETQIQKDPVTKSIKATPAMKAAEIENHHPKLPNILMSSTGSFAEYAGVLYYKENDFENAKSSFDLANKINPNLGKADYYKYLIALAEKKPDSAYQFIKSSFYRRARDFEIYKMVLNMATTLRDTTEIFKAYHHYNGIHHAPRALTEAASKLVQMKTNPRMLMDFIEEEKAGFHAMENPIPQADSVFSAMYNHIGQQFFAQRQKTEAYELYQKGLEANPENSNLMVNLGLYYVREKNYDQAIDWLYKAVERPEGLLRDNGNAEYTLALCLIVKGEQSRGCEFFVKAADKKYAGATAAITKYCR